jgi:hypothetical protein
MQPTDEFKTLFDVEMRAVNEPAGHNQVYLRAAGKKYESDARSAAPEILYDGGLRVVKDDVPYLMMGD